MNRLVPPVAAAAVFLVHLTWTVLLAGGTSSGWGNVPAPIGDRFALYFTEGAFWLGASYALAGAFTAFAVTRFRRDRPKAAAGAAGGVALFGGLYAVGCFLLGCCGSPLLPVYLGLLGGRCGGLGGPLMFGLTLFSIAIGAVLLRREKPRGCADSSSNRHGSG